MHCVLIAESFNQNTKKWYKKLILKQKIGLNSDWETSIIMSKKKDGTFTCDVSLPKNTEHQFKYRVNENEWVNEPEADKEVTNEFGGINSVIVI